MTTIQIDQETAEGLNNQANALGMTMQEYLRWIALNRSLSSVPPGELPYEQWSKLFQKWISGFPETSHYVDDSRESIYAGRGE